MYKIFDTRKGEAISEPFEDEGLANVCLEMLIIEQALAQGWELTRAWSLGVDNNPFMLSVVEV